MLHKCTYCDYNTTVKSNLRRHVKNKHEQNINVTYSSVVPSSMYVGNNAPPTTINAHPTQLGSGNIITNGHTSRCELDPSQVYNPPAKTVSIEEYNKANESAHGWKSAYDNLNNQTGSGIFTQEDIDEVHKRGVEAIRNWEIAHQKEK